MSSHRIDASLPSFLGLAAVVAAMALAMPGLQVARAAEDAAEAPAAIAAGAMSVDPLLVQKEAPAPRLELPQLKQEPKEVPKQGPSCENSGRPSTLSDALAEYQTQQVLREIAKRAAAQQAAPRSTEEGIVLNGRGYNYRPTGLRAGP